MYHPRYNDILFFGVILSFLVGVLIRSFVDIPLIMYGIFGSSALTFFLCFVRRKKVWAFLLLIFSCFIVLGSLRFEIQADKQEEISNLSLVDTTLSGEIVSEPEYFSNYQRFIIKTNYQKQGFKVLVMTDRYPEFYFGDTVRIVGDFVKPENFITDTGREFDYEAYLSKDNIYFIHSFGDVTLEEEGNTVRVRTLLFSLKQSFLNASSRIIPEPESSLLGGVLLGVKQSLGDDLEQNFIDTGTIHIVVLSGYNVTIISEAIVRNLKLFLSERLSLLFGSFGIVLFVIMSGASVATVRAGIMGLLGLLARVTGRTYDILRALALTAFCMVMANPLTLAFDISFQLSFIATLGLILVTPIITTWRFVRCLPERFGLREIFASTLATQITVLPYLLYKIGTLSVIAPLANLLVLPTIPFSMGFGFLAGLLEMSIGFGGEPFAWISFGFLHYVVKVVSFLASFSWSAFVVSEIPMLLVIIAYAGLAWWVIHKNKISNLSIIK